LEIRSGIRPPTVRRTSPFLQICLLSAAFLLFAGCSSVDAAQRTAELADLSLEELAQIKVTSVFRREAPLSDAPASIFVITRDDIRRSGAITLAQVLRLAPNLQVAQLNATRYAISARGFNNAVGNKLLVLIDGRTVYTPLFSGVFWDQQDVMLEDVERIEVISGPGATLWGANAVTGSLT
jgi:iron complex outermembrane receptor protein